MYPLFRTPITRLEAHACGPGGPELSRSKYDIASKDGTQIRVPMIYNHLIVYTLPLAHDMSMPTAHTMSTVLLSSGWVQRAHENSSFRSPAMAANSCHISTFSQHTACS